MLVPDVPETTATAVKKYSLILFHIEIKMY